MNFTPPGFTKLPGGYVYKLLLSHCHLRNIKKESLVNSHCGAKSEGNTVKDKRG